MELGESQVELKHVCKICSKSFASGTSLGGHMRSHVTTDISDRADVSKLNKKKFPRLSTHLLSNPKHNPNINNKKNKKKNTESIYDISTASLGYVLREKPKRTLKFSDHHSIEDKNSNSSNSLQLEKSCKECGKVFQSWKALFGHMKYHSLEKERSHNTLEEEDQEEQDSSSIAINKKNSNLHLDNYDVKKGNFASSYTEIDLRNMGLMKNFTTKQLKWSSKHVSELKDSKEEYMAEAKHDFVERDVDVAFGFVNDNDEEEIERIMDQGAQVVGEGEGIQREETQQGQGEHEAKRKDKGKRVAGNGQGISLSDDDDDDDHYYLLQKFYTKCREVEYQNMEIQAYLKTLLANQKVIMENMGFKFLEPVLPMPFEEREICAKTTHGRMEREKENAEKGDEAIQAIEARAKSTQVAEVSPTRSSLAPRSILKTSQRFKLSVRRRHASTLAAHSKAVPSLDPIVEETIVPTPTPDPNADT